MLGEIMKRRANGLKLVVGHSKGAVIIANALADPGGDWMKRTAPHLYDLTYGNYPKKQSLPWGGWDKEVDKWKKRMEPLVAAIQQQAAPVMKEDESPWMGVWKEHMEKEQRESMDLWLKQAVQAMGGLVPRLEAVEQAGREQAGREQAEASGESVPGTEDNPPLRIVTFGRPSAMPKAQHLVWQYMGTHDALGWCNRAIGTDTLLVPFKGHSLNPFTPMHMPLARLLDRARQGNRSATRDPFCTRDLKGKKNPGHRPRPRGHAYLSPRTVQDRSSGLGRPRGLLPWGSHGAVRALSRIRLVIS